jgi:feruloyl-CoA synthase
MFGAIFGSRRSRFARVDVAIERLKGGETVLSNRIPLSKGYPTLVDALEQRAALHPESIFLAERRNGAWHKLSYRSFLDQVRERAARVLGTACSPDRPMMILAPNSIDHAITAMAAMYVGIPASPISPAYALASGAHEKLEKVIGVLQPGSIFIGDPSAFAVAVPVLERFAPGNIFSHVAADNVRTINSVASASDEFVMRRRAMVRPDTTAKVLFTSGSTGMPKGVINTHLMAMSNMAALGQLWGFLAHKPPVIVDWLPWSHTFGGNVCFNAALCSGGTFYIDEGKPTAALIGNTVENIKSVSPSLHFNVPAGIEALLPHLESDAVFARHFFRDLDAIFVAAAALPQKARDRLRAVGIKTTGRPPTLLAGWGSTETAPFATCVYFPTDRADNLGLPIPGTSIKFAPEQDKLELRVKGPNVTPGYWRNESATKAAFDQDGFYRMGDAGQLLEASNPKAGVKFAGRLGENFKLSSGTWVNVGPLRVGVVDRLRPYVSDVVITGHNQETIGALLVLNMEAISRTLGCTPAEVSLSRLNNDPVIIETIRGGILAHNAENPGSSTGITAFALLPRAPDLSRDEITDKGYLNQRAMLASWSSVVDCLHGEPGPQDVGAGVVRLEMQRQKA